MTEDVNHTVYDGDRAVQFIGRELGRASSAEVGKKRWTEVVIFKTQAGNFIVQTLGMSAAPGETVRHKAQVCDSAEAAIEVLHAVDGDGVRFITKLHRKAALAAADVDDEFRRAWFLERVA